MRGILLAIIPKVLQLRIIQLSVCGENGSKGAVPVNRVENRYPSDRRMTWLTRRMGLSSGAPTPKGSKVMVGAGMTIQLLRKRAIAANPATIHRAYSISELNQRSEWTNRSNNLQSYRRLGPCQSANGLIHGWVRYWDNNTEQWVTEQWVSELLLAY